MFVQAGNVQNRGLELSLGFDKKFGDFNYNTTFTATTNKNKIIQLARDVLNPVTNTLIDLTDIQVGRFRLREGGDVYKRQLQACSACQSVRLLRDWCYHLPDVSLYYGLG